MRAPYSTGSLKSLLAVIAMALILVPSAQAEGFEDSRAADVLLSALDVTIIRPLATVRVVLGAGLFLPALLLSAPMGREGYDGAYDVLIDAPTEFAFRRKIGAES